MSDTHFTYNFPVDKTTLKQGDIIQKTPELVELLNQYHSYYGTTEDYTHFQILTQTCDLVRRGRSNECSSRYITLAAVRNLETVINRAITEFAEKRVQIGSDTYCSDKHKDQLKSKLSSLFNNNDKDFFFLKSSPVEGLLDDSCTFLHLSIAIRAYEHYDLCLDAKILELKENFRAKLGWMVGNLYSRVGTEDYVPAALDKDGFQKLLEETLTRHVAWVDNHAFQYFKKAAKPGLSYDEIIDAALMEMEDRKRSRMRNLVDLLATACNLNTEQKDKALQFLISSTAESFVK